MKEARPHWIQIRIQIEMKEEETGARMEQTEVQMEEKEAQMKGEREAPFPFRQTTPRREFVYCGWRGWAFQNRSPKRHNALSVLSVASVSAVDAEYAGHVVYAL